MKREKVNSLLVSFPNIKLRIFPDKPLRLKLKGEACVDLYIERDLESSNFLPMLVFREIPDGDGKDFKFDEPLIDSGKVRGYLKKKEVTIPLETLFEWQFKKRNTEDECLALLGNLLARERETRVDVVTSEESKDRSYNADSLIEISVSLGTIWSGKMDVAFSKINDYFDVVRG